VRGLGHQRLHHPRKGSNSNRCCDLVRRTLDLAVCDIPSGFASILMVNHDRRIRATCSEENNHNFVPPVRNLTHRPRCSYTNGTLVCRCSNGRSTIRPLWSGYKYKSLPIPCTRTPNSEPVFFVNPRQSLFSTRHTRFKPPKQPK